MCPRHSNVVSWPGVQYVACDGLPSRTEIVSLLPCGSVLPAYLADSKSVTDMSTSTRLRLVPKAVSPPQKLANRERL